MGGVRSFCFDSRERADGGWPLARARTRALERSSVVYGIARAAAELFYYQRRRLGAPRPRFVSLALAAVAAARRCTRSCSQLSSVKVGGRQARAQSAYFRLKCAIDLCGFSGRARGFSNNGTAGARARAKEWLDFSTTKNRRASAKGGGGERRSEEAKKANARRSDRRWRGEFFFRLVDKTARKLLAAAAAAAVAAAADTNNVRCRRRAD